ncbi:MAG: peptidoglycan D,D-transpeptidase FtsI family protein [Verrucomicrobiales bacterium]
MKPVPLQSKIRFRLIVAAMCVVTGFTLVSLRLLNVQVAQHEKWLERAEGDYARREVLPARRGCIFDRNGEQLVHNRPSFSMMADRNHLEDVKVAIEGLARARGVKPADLRRLYGKMDKKNEERVRAEYLEYVATVLADYLPGGIEMTREALDFGRRRQVVLAEQLDSPEVQTLRQAFAERGVQGIYFEEGMRRYYPMGQSLCHILGFVDKSGRGCEGVEANMESWLNGTPGYRQLMVDRRGRQVPAYRSSEVPVKHGSNLYLTVDAGLQRIAEEELAAGFQEFGYKHAAIVLMDPMTADVLALANYPAFDPNSLEGERRNFAFSDLYEPGSTFKIVAHLAALDAGVVTPSTSIFCHNGNYSDGPVQIRDVGHYGDLSVAMVLAKSSNIGTFKIARMVGMDRYYEYVRRFGFGQRTGMGLTGEVAGLVRQERNIVDFSRCSYGYSVSVTPVQLANAYCAIANGGVLLRPRVVREVRDNDGKLLWENQREEKHRVASAKACRQLLVGMREVVDANGTGKLADVPGYTVAGKTGTAHRWSVELKNYDKERPVVSFAGFLPAEQPRLVAVVVCSEPTSNHVKLAGGTVAAPIFARVATRAMEQMAVPPDRPLPETASSEP